MGKKNVSAMIALSTAEKKLIFVFTYYIVFAVLTLAYYSVATRDHYEFIDAVKEYFFCEAGGYDPENPCPRDYEQYRYPRLQSTVFAVMGFIPMMNLVFVINTQRVMQEVGRVLPRLSRLYSFSNPSKPFEASSSGTSGISDTPTVRYASVSVDSKV